MIFAGDIPSFSGGKSYMYFKMGDKSRTESRRIECVVA